MLNMFRARLGPSSGAHDDITVGHMERLILGFWWLVVRCRLVGYVTGLTATACGQQWYSRELLMMGIDVPEICWAYHKWNKTQIASSWFFFHQLFLRLFISLQRLIYMIIIKEQITSFMHCNIMLTDSTANWKKRVAGKAFYFGRNILQCYYNSQPVIW
jgi:hypothetical protein